MGDKVNSIIPSSSIKSRPWPEALRNGTGDRIKNWAGLLMGLAALITAIGAVWKPENEKVKSSYVVLSKNLSYVNKDIKILTNKVKYLYLLRKKEEQRKRILLELIKSYDTNEDKFLFDFLSKKYGKSYAKKYITRRKRRRLELKQEYKIKLRKTFDEEIKIKDIPKFEEL